MSAYSVGIVQKDGVLKFFYGKTKYVQPIVDSVMKKVKVNFVDGFGTLYFFDDSEKMISYIKKAKTNGFNVEELTEYITT
jgi:hypothetical protein